MIPAKNALSSGEGYSSIYQFRKEDAKEIMARGHSRGLKEYSVYSEWLWIDIDDGDLDEARRRFDELAEKFNDYQKVGFFSGKKGYHLGIKTEPMYGRHVPYSHRKWVQENGVDADESLYQHGRLFRNVGATHEATGKRKELILETEGKELVIPTVIEPVRVPKAIFTEDYAQSDVFREALLTIIQKIEVSPRQGMRHTTMWGISKDLCEAGASYELAEALMLYLNDTFTHPKDNTEVVLATEQGYEGHQRKNEKLAGP